MGVSVVSSQQLAEAPVWQGEAVTLQCIQVIDETPSVKTFCLQGQSPLRFVFKPGQFVTLEQEIDGSVECRAYTIASSPATPYRLELTIRRDGKVSNWLLDNLVAGGVLKITGLGGGFNLDDLPAEKYLFLGGGVGITPVMAMSRYLAAVHPDADIHFIASARGPEEQIFATELKQLARRLPHFKLNLAVDEGADASAELLAGPLNREQLAALVPDLAERKVYCCGPEGYMQAMSDYCQDLGLCAEHFYLEHFASAPAAPEAATASDKMAFEIKVQSSGRAVTAAPGQTVLEALEGAGVPINAACRSGVCGCCKSRALSGSVDARSTETLTEQEIADGYFLACACTPSSDLVME